MYQQSLSKRSSMPAHWVRRLGKDSKENQVRFASWNSNLLIHQVNNNLNKCFENMDECLDVETVIKNQLTLNGFDIMAQNYLLDGPELKLTFEEGNFDILLFYDYVISLIFFSIFFSYDIETLLVNRIL